VIAFTWMRSVTQSVERADRATSIALLEKSIAEQAQADALQKRQLEDEIQEIIHVHSQVSNGNLDVRIPLRQGNLLWPVAGSLNSLITRLRGSLNDTRRLKQTDEAIIRFYQMRRERQNSIIPWQPTGTAIDVLVQQHNTFVQQQSHATRFPRHQKFEPK
jgi:methyl-accepting chemotaxis protein